MEDDPSVTATAYYYDQWNHVSQEVSVNLAEDVSVREWNSSTISGLPVRRSRRIRRGTFSLDEQYTYAYDHAERLLSVKHKVGNMPEKTLLSNDYDDLGRLRSKSLGNVTDSVAYAYNVRDWMTTVKSSDFTQHLYYNSGPGTKQYGGYVSGTLWKHGDGAMHGYTLSYDGAGRLISGNYSEYEDGGVVSGTAGRYDETVTSYDLNGNIGSLRRNGMAGSGESEFLSMSIDGNMVTTVHDSESGSLATYTYDTNGRMTSDSGRGVLSVEYNSLSLPEHVEFEDGSLTSYVYDAEGTKLRTVYNMPEGIVRTDYCRGLLFENDVPAMLLTETGFLGISDGLYRHYIHDHLGNVRVVRREDGTVEETDDYYPFGGRLETAGQADVQPYKYSGKELESRHGIDWYDFGARRYDPLLARWTTPDPLLEKYYGVSPYAFCNNNPVNFVDPDGRQIQFFEIARNSGSLSNYAYTRNLYNCETGDYNIIGYYDKDNNLIGYGAIRNGRLEYVMDEVNDLDRFVNNLSTYSLAADFFYLNGTPDNGTINVVTGNIGRGLLQMWGTALRNPVYYLYTASVWGKAFLNVPSKNKVYFGQNSNQRHHTFRHTDGLGLSRTHVKMAVLEDLKYIANTIKPNSSINRVVNVDGKNIQYTVYRLSNNEFNIGRIHEK